MADSDVTSAALGPEPWGSRWLGNADEGALRRRVRVQVLLTIPVIVANMIGVAVASVLIAFVLPGPSVLTGDLVLLNFVAAPVYGVVASLAGLAWGTVWALRTLRWSTDPDRVPTPAEQTAAAAVPWRLMLMQAALWVGGLIVLTPLYARHDWEFVPKIVLGMGFSAIVVCAYSYLIAEFALRPVTARVLEAGTARRRRGIGVFGRSVLVWLVGSGTPITLLMAVAVLALTDPKITTARLAVCVLALGGAILVFGLLLQAQTMAATVAPIRGVRNALRRVENGDLAVAVTVYDGTELGELQSGFNHTVAGLRERERVRDLFGRHVGQDVAAAAMAGPSELTGMECDAAALFIDIIGSTAMTATRPAAEIVALLNEFFGIVVDEVERQGGLLNKFEGDAALAVFGAPAPLPDAAGAALAAARHIRHRLSTAAIEIDAGIGVAAGRVVAGNVGAYQRYEFTVIGDAVNEAARLCELAKAEPERVLTSAATVAAAGPGEGIHWAAGESVILRGRIRPTRLVRPLTAAVQGAEHE
ncbi:adenylate/guanylate cyclase domain-containing protein [Nocardia inohanensis]|uniref:adenylate/guanylate cyclase domain-containing protein n=1 Tax=Nocardia inohanensis TaxID=209246 RepID=UPI000A73D129|nr:adenylate/guanylate cyclase domain-containing protein [Nocardia inohanensis]